MVQNIKSYLILVFVLIGMGITSLSCGVKQAKSTSIVDGTWKFIIKTPRGERNPIVTINGSKGTYNEDPIAVTVEGNKFSFLAGEDAGVMGRMEFTYEATVTEDQLSGVYTIEKGSLKGRQGEFTGERIKK